MISRPYWVWKTVPPTRRPQHFISATLTSLSSVLVTTIGGGQGRAGTFIPSKWRRKINGWKGEDYELG